MSSSSANHVGRHLDRAVDDAFRDDRQLYHECAPVIDKFCTIIEALDAEDLHNALRTRQVLKLVSASGFLGVTADPVFGGCSLSAVGRHLCTEYLARICNELAFLAQQHLGSVALMNAERHLTATAKVLAKYAVGERTIGIAASHLREEGSAGGVMIAPEGDRLRLRGTAAWVSGYGVFDDVLVGGHGKDGKPMFAVIPFQDAEGVAINVLPDLWAMQKTSTVSMRLDLLVDPDAMVATDQKGRFTRAHGGYLFQPICHLLGILYRSLRHIATFPTLDDETAKSLLSATAQTGEDRIRFYELVAQFATGNETTAMLDEMLELRVVLVQRTFSLAATVCALSGGKSLLGRFAPGRLLQEAVFFSTTTVNPQVKVAIAKCLATPVCPSSAMTAELAA